MKKSFAKLTAAGLFIISVMCVSAIANSCQADGLCGKDSAATLKRLWEKFSAECKKETGIADEKKCLTKENLEKILPRLRRFAETNIFAVGPRDLMLGSAQNGTIVNPAFRTFLTPNPLIENTVKIEITKKAGKGGAIVKICKVDEKGGFTNLKTIIFEEKEIDSPTTKTETVTGVRGHILQIFIGGSDTSGKAFDYTLKTTAN